MNFIAAIFGSIFMVLGCVCLDRYINKKREILFLELAVIGLVNGFYIIGLTY